MANGVSRACTLADIPRLRELNARAASDTASASGSHLGEFYWALRATPDDDLTRSMQVWEQSDSSLAAAAWLDPPGGDDFIVMPATDERLLDEVLDWLERETRAAGGAALSVIARQPDTTRADALQRRGYTPSDGGNVRFRRTLEAAPPGVELPGGFSIRSVSTDDDLKARAFVETEAFGVTTTADRWSLLAGRLPNYRPALDLLVVAPDGTGASACTCWYDETSHRGEVEAVGTSRDYRRLGLGKAAVTEGLGRLSDLGATEAVLYTSIGNVASAALYRSCGFEVVGEDFAWIKRL